MRLSLLLSSACSVFLIVPLTAAFFTGVLPLSPNQQHREQLLGKMNAFLTEKLEHAYGADKDSFDHPEAEFQHGAKFESAKFDWLCHIVALHQLAASTVIRDASEYPPTCDYGFSDYRSAYAQQYDKKACNALKMLTEEYDKKYDMWYPERLEQGIANQKRLLKDGWHWFNPQNTLRRLLERKLTFSIFCSDADTARAEQFTKAYLQCYEPEEAS